MRRVLGLVLTGLGAFFLVLAVLMRFYLPGQVIKFPLNEYLVISVSGNNVSYFSAKQLREITGVAAKATTTVEGDVTAGSSSTAVWNSFTAVQDMTNNAPIEYVTQRSAFNRRTGEIVDCCGAYVSISDLPTVKGHQSGLAYAWPLGTQKRTYDVFDATLAKPEPFRYEATATVDGLTAYKFTEQVTNQQFSSQTVPGSLAGYPGLPSVTLPEYLTETNTFWIDPVTGQPVNVTENRTLALENISGATRLILYRGDLTGTPQNVRSNVNTASAAHFKIDLIEDIGPLVGLILGVALLAVGIALILGRRDTEEFAYESDEPVGSTT
jgi:Porin PorA